MKCKSCSEEITYKFAFAISSNTCPMCGGEIVSEELRNILSELKEVMQATAQYRAEIFDWLYSNYQLVSKDSEEYKALQAQSEMATSAKIPLRQALTTIDPKTVSLDRNGNQVSGAAIQDQEVTNKFLQRAQVKPNDQKNLRDIVNQIKKGGGSSGPSIVAEADPEEVAAMGSQLAGGGLGSLNGATDYDEYGNDDDDALPPIVEAMAQQAHGSQSGDYNARDVAKLQAIHSKQKRASNALSKGGGVGLIRR